MTHSAVNHLAEYHILILLTQQLEGKHVCLPSSARVQTFYSLMSLSLTHSQWEPYYHNIYTHMTQSTIVTGIMNVLNTN